MLSTVKTPAEKTHFSSLALRAARRLFILAGFLVLATLLVPQANAQAVGKAQTAPKVQMQPAGPCCQITSMDASGRVTAQDNTTGKTFQFQVNDSSVLNSLHLGQSVSADFNSSLVTIYGAGPCCSITSSGVASGAGTVPGSGGAPGGAKSQSHAAASTKASLATAESDLPGIRMELLELRRVGNSVTLKFTLFNDGSKEFALGLLFGYDNNIANTRLADPLTNTTYPVIMPGGGECLCSAKVPPIASKSKAVLWAKFAVPPQVQRVSVAIPRFAPLDDVPISTGP